MDTYSWQWSEKIIARMWAHSTMFIEIAVKRCALTLDLFLLSSNTATKISDIQKWLPLIFSNKIASKSFYGHSLDVQWICYGK